MENSEIYAKLVVVERLLVILLSDCRYADLINAIKEEVDGYTDDFSKDIDARVLELYVNQTLKTAVDEISINHILQVLK
jgi:hypothetical protein